MSIVKDTIAITAITLVAGLALGVVSGYHSRSYRTAAGAVQTGSIQGCL